jgi:hypothetical protein
MNERLEPASESRITKVELAVLGGVLVFGIALRVIALGHIPGINGDEAWYGVQVAMGLAGEGWATQTRSGNILNPFHSGCILFLELAHPTPAFWLLRVPSLLAGLLLIALAYPLLREPLGRESALIATLLLASLPVNIAYSRFGWDASQTMLAGLICLALVLRERYGAVVIAFGAAFLVHPTNLLLAPALVGAAGGALWPRSKEMTPAQKKKCLVATLAAGCMFAALVATLFLPQPGVAKHALANRLQRAADVAGWLSFIRLAGQLLTGVTIYRYIAGPVSRWAVALSDVVFWALALPIVVLGLRGLIRRRRWKEIGLACGLVVGLALLYLMGGLPAIRPSQERYALFSVTPICVLAAMLLRDLDLAWLNARRVFIGAGAGCCVLLAVFYREYFVQIQRAGSLSEKTFWTGPVEPKAAAAEIIRNHVRPGARVTVLAEDWWVYWPLRYLLGERSGIRYARYDVGADVQLSVVRASDQLFAVGFAGGPMETRLANPLHQWEVPGYGRKAVLHVWEFSADHSPPRPPTRSGS